MQKNNLQGLLKEAEKLRKKKYFPISLFSSPDYIQSADLFMEAAALTENDGSATILSNRENYYMEAASTYLLCKDEYGSFKAAEAYRAIRDMYKNRLELQSGAQAEEGEEHELTSNKEHIKFLKEKICHYSRLLATSMQETGRFMMAGQAYMECANVAPDLAQVAQYCMAAVENFGHDGKCPSHQRMALEQLLKAYLEADDFVNARKTLLHIGNKALKFYELSLHLLGILNGDLVENTLENKSESVLISRIINNGKLEALAFIDEFISNLVLPEYCKIIFAKLQCTFKPEYDIC